MAVGVALSLSMSLGTESAGHGIQMDGGDGGDLSSTISGPHLEQGAGLTLWPLGKLLLQREDEGRVVWPEA